MNLLAFDTATPATVVGLLPDGAKAALAATDLPAAGERPRHAADLLALARGLLDRAHLRFADLDRVAVGTGPGSFTGVRVGVATARALASGADAEIAAVSTLEALALPARAAHPASAVLAVIDARRGEAFAAAWAGGEQLFPPRALAPEALAALAGEHGAGGADPWLAVGDGAVRFAQTLVTAGVAVAPGDSPLHQVTAEALCELGAAEAPSAPAAVLPEYLREPDAKVKRRPDEP